MQNHHNIPISIWGANNSKNIIRIADDKHCLLHNTQNVNADTIRKYRKKINHILIPDDYVMDLKKDLWNRYFQDPKILIREQKYSLLLQQSSSWLNMKSDFTEIIESIIAEQKFYIKSLLK